MRSLLRAGLTHRAGREAKLAALTDPSAPSDAFRSERARPV